MPAMHRVLLVFAFVVVTGGPLMAHRAKPAMSNPVVVFETVKGTIEIELFVADAPKSTAHLLDLIRHNFYRGLRFHRVEATLAQIGDPQSKNVAMEGYW